MLDLLEEINTTYQTRSSYNIDVDENDKIECTKKSHYCVQKANTTLFGRLSFRGLGPKILALIPGKLKRIQSLDILKDKLKNTKFEQCPCNICRKYIYGGCHIN